MAPPAVHHVVTVCDSTFSHHKLMRKGQPFVLAFEERPGPLLVTVYEINVDKKRIKTRFREWCVPAHGATLLRSPLHVNSPDGNIVFGEVQDLAKGTFASSQATVASHYEAAANALKKWQEVTKGNLPGTFRSDLVTRITAESNQDPEGSNGATYPPTVDMGLPALRLSFASDNMWRRILRDVARYAEAAIGRLKQPDNTAENRRYAAVGFGGALRGEYYPETRSEDDRELTLGLQMDCDDFVLRVAAFIHGLQQAFRGEERCRGCTPIEKAILAAIKNQTPLFAVVRARPPMQAQSIGHVVCILTDGAYTGGELRNPWLIECTTATEPMSGSPSPSELCRQTQKGEYLRLFYVATPSAVTYFFTKTEKPNTYEDGIPFTNDASGPLLVTGPNIICRTRTAEAKPNVGQSLRQATNWDDAVEVCKQALGAAAGSTAPTRVTSTMHSWSLKIDPKGALWPILGWGE